MALSIASVTLVVPAYEAGLAFYAGVLGFEVVEDTALGGGKRWVVVAPSGGGARLLLAEAATSRQRQAIGSGRVAFFLATDDFDRDHARMAAAGVNFLEAPRAEAYGKVVVFEDPFGNRWDLIGPPDASAGRIEPNP